MDPAAGLARVTQQAPQVTWVGEGVYRVEHEGRIEVVYVADGQGERWAFWNGHVFKGGFDALPAPPRRAARADAPEALTAPMPATIVRVLVEPGAAVKKGEVVIILEAMKMELALRAPRDAVVVAIHCREGEMVQPDAVLVDLR